MVELAPGKKTRLSKFWVVKIIYCWNWIRLDITSFIFGTSMSVLIYLQFQCQFVIALGFPVYRPNSSWMLPLFLSFLCVSISMIFSISLTFILFLPLVHLLNTIMIILLLDSSLLFNSLLWDLFLRLSFLSSLFFLLWQSDL